MYVLCAEPKVTKVIVAQDVRIAEAVIMTQKDTIYAHVADIQVILRTIVL